MKLWALYHGLLNFAAIYCHIPSPTGVNLGPGILTHDRSSISAIVPVTHLDDSFMQIYIKLVTDNILKIDCTNMFFGIFRRGNLVYPPTVKDLPALRVVNANDMYFELEDDDILLMIFSQNPTLEISDHDDFIKSLRPVHDFVLLKGQLEQLKDKVKGMVIASMFFSSRPKLLSSSLPDGNNYNLIFKGIHPFNIDEKSRSAHWIMKQDHLFAVHPNGMIVSVRFFNSLLITIGQSHGAQVVIVRKDEIIIPDPNTHMLTNINFSVDRNCITTNYELHPGDIVMILMAIDQGDEQPRICDLVGAVLSTEDLEGYEEEIHKIFRYNPKIVGLTAYIGKEIPELKE